MLSAWGIPIPAQGSQAVPAPLGGLLPLTSGLELSYLPLPDPSLTAPAKPEQTGGKFPSGEAGDGRED